MIHSRTLHALEFPQITEHLASLCLSPAGRERALELRPLEDAAAVTHAARLYDESAVWAARPMGEGGFALGSFPDVGAFLRVAEKPGLQPDTDAFWALREMLRLAKAAHASIALPEAEDQWPHLLALAQETPLPVQLTAALLRCISDDGLIRDESSPELFQVRSELRRLHQNCMRRVKDYAMQYNMLAWLQESGIPAALVTSSNDRKMQAVRRARPELEGYFSAWVTADKVTHSKPHPECFLLGAQLLGRGPGECVVFEDSFHGLAAGRAAGMTVVGLATTKSRAELEGRADLLIDDFARLSPAALWEEIGGLS